MFLFIGFAFVAFPLHWMSPCSSASATQRAKHIVLPTGNSAGIRDIHAELFLILPVSFFSPGSFSPWTVSSLPSPFPESPFFLSLMLHIWVLPCHASSCQAWLHAQWFSKALRLTVIFKLRTCWSAPLNRDQIIHVLKDKHLLKYFAEFRPKHTH